MGFHLIFPYIYIQCELVTDLTCTQYCEMRILFRKGRMLVLNLLYKARHSKSLTLSKEIGYRHRRQQESLSVLA